MNKRIISNRINEQLNTQLQEDQALNLQKAMKVTPLTCIFITLCGLLLQSSTILALAALSTLIGAFSRNSLYDRVYNIWVKNKVPSLGIARSIGCGFGAMVLSISAYGFYAGYNLLAFATGGFMIILAGLAAITQICFVSKLLRVFKKNKACC